MLESFASSHLCWNATLHSVVNTCALFLVFYLVRWPFYRELLVNLLAFYDTRIFRCNAILHCTTLHCTKTCYTIICDGIQCSSVELWPSNHGSFGDSLYPCPHTWSIPPLQFYSGSFLSGLSSFAFLHEVLTFSFLLKLAWTSPCGTRTSVSSKVPLGNQNLHPVTYRHDQSDYFRSGTPIMIITRYCLSNRSFNSMPYKISHSLLGPSRILHTDIYPKIWLVIRIRQKCIKVKC